MVEYQGREASNVLCFYGEPLGSKLLQSCIDVNVDDFAKHHRLLSALRNPAQNGPTERYDCRAALSKR
jgi:hypothetical protein